MKYLILGIDGCHDELFYRFDMPFMQGMIGDGNNLNLKEDLISRGWAEICTGKHAVENNGYYERPVGSSSYDWTVSYKMLETIENDPDVDALWSVLNKNGMTVGVMNVPTTNPAPKVDGFFVSGGGGGRAVAQDVAEDQCWPRSIKGILDEEGYIVDERMPSLLFEKKLYATKDFFSRLKEMNQKRVDSYIKLYKKYPVDVGFIVFRSMVVVECIMAAEIHRYMQGDNNVNLDLIEGARDFYEHFDLCLKKLYVALSPDKAVFVSDHGQVPKFSLFNVNYMLRLLGYQKLNKGAGSLSMLARRYRGVLPYKIRNLLKKSSVVSKGYADVTPFDKLGTMAFNVCLGTSASGIFINDCDRFKGRVDSKEIYSISMRLIDDVNNSEFSEKYGVKAYRSSRKDYDAQGFFPDVMLELPLMMQPAGYELGAQNRLVIDVEESKRPIQLSEVTTDLWTGTKGYYPLSVCVNHDCPELSLYSGKDLTVIKEIMMKELGI